MPKSTTCIQSGLMHVIVSPGIIHLDETKPPSRPLDQISSIVTSVPLKAAPRVASIQLPFVALHNQHIRTFDLNPAQPCSPRVCLNHIQSPSLYTTAAKNRKGVPAFLALGDPGGNGFPKWSLAGCRPCRSTSNGQAKTRHNISNVCRFLHPHLHSCFF